MDFSFVDLPTLAIFLATLLFALRLWSYKAKKTPPGPWGIPILGYLPFINKDAPYETLLKLKGEYGKMFQIQMGNVPTVVISDPYIIKRIFNMEAFSGRAPLYLTHGIMKGYGLICSEGQLWREHRKFASSVMRSLCMGKNLDEKESTESAVMSQLSEYLQFLKENKGKPIDVVAKLRHCIGNTINALVFGVSYTEDDPTWIYLQHLLDEGFKEVAVAGPLNFLPFFRFVPKYKRSMEFILDGQKKTHAHYEEIIQKIQPNPGRISSIAEAYVAEMGRLGSNPGTFTKMQLYCVLADMFGAGTDTAMTTIKWILLYVTKHQDVQRKIHEELDHIVGRDHQVQVSNLPSLSYTEAVILEVMRIHNILPLGVPHGCLEDSMVDGYEIAKGTMVLPFIWGMNLDEELWPEPLIFRPERFLDSETGLVTVPGFFMPFQKGRRMCIGEDFGRTLLLLYTSSILHNFSLDLEENYDLGISGDYGFTLVPRPYKIITALRLE